MTYKMFLFLFILLVPKLCADTVINGFSSGNIILSAGSELFIENNTTTTLKNLTLTNLSAERLVMGGIGSTLALENVTVFLDGDYSFTQGHLYIHDDVNICGTNSFAYQAAQQSYIAPFSTLYFDVGSTFSYKPTVATRTLLSMNNETSRLYLNGCTLYSTSTGFRLDRGTVLFDNFVTLSADGQVDSESISFGESDNVVTEVLSAACVEIFGYVNFD